MNISSLSELFSRLLNHKVYKVNFPDFTEGTQIKLEIISGVQELGGVMDFNVQFMVKATHPAEAERVANEILDNLNMTTNELFADDRFQLILCKASSPQPFFIGESEIGEHVFSVDFRLLVTRI